MQALRTTSLPGGGARRRVRSLHVLYSGLGGHGREFFTLAEAADPGVELAAAFFGIEPLLPGYAESCRRLGIEFRSVLKRPGTYAGPWLELYRMLRELRPDVLTLYGASTLPVACAYRLRSGAPVVVVETQANALKSGPERLASRLAMRFADRVVCLTEPYAAELRALCGAGYRASKVRVIGNGLDLAAFAPGSRAGARESRPLKLGMQSRLVAIKDHDTLIRAFARLRTMPGLESTELHIAGGGETEPALRALARGLDVQHAVCFHGTLAEPELIRFMQELDVYVHATLGESFSFSIMEALACGLPVVTSRVPVLDETLPGLEFVTLCEPRDPGSLAAALEPLLRDGELRRRLGADARRYAERSLSMQDMAQRHAALIAELVAMPPATLAPAP